MTATAPPRPAAATAGRLRAVARRGVRALGSFRLSVAIFALMFVVVLVGTLRQTSMSLYDVQRVYFESVVFTLPLFGTVPLPLPGGATLIGALAVNLLVGGVLRMRIGRSTVGVLVTHAGILLLLVGSAVEYAGSAKGNVRLREGEASSVFESYTDWELAVVDVAAGREHVVPQPDLERAADGGAVAFATPALPFELVVSTWVPNADARRAPRPDLGAEGVVLVALPRDPRQAEANVAGCYVEVRPRGGGPAVRGVLWAGAEAPFSADVDGRAFAFELRRRSWALPFTVRLDRAVAREHPGTSIPKEYSSYVTRLGRGREGLERAVHITMNEPMREGGYTFYQSTYGKETDGRVFSGFAVVRNPTDRVPIVACSILGVGMALHFLRKLANHVASQGSRRAAGPAAGGEASHAVGSRA